MAANEGDEATVSLEDLQEAMVLLAGSDPENCSYSKGYVKRQAVFACNTCTPSGTEPAGLCLACANKCHDGHDVLELYTKRNFRCDCGNGKFGEFQCTLVPNKDGQNNKNIYNHNFRGFYCSCDRPFPDTDDQPDDEMIQCIICEDWFHDRHLGCEMEESEELQEMVCENCMNSNPFLWIYAAHIAVPPVIKLSPSAEEEEVNVEEDGSSEEKSEPAMSPDCRKREAKEKITTSSKKPRQEISGSPVECKLKDLQVQGLPRSRVGAVFWPCHWRALLCTCTSCKRAYVRAGVQFLMDQSDTLLAYEAKGRVEPFGEDLLMRYLGSLDRIQQLEMIYHFNDFRTQLTAFLQQFTSEGKVITVEAIHTFFDELRSRRRQNTNAGQDHSS